MADPVIRAAGVVLVRPALAGPQVLLVHRPRHRDWSLPKGKLDPGEHVVTAAVRECDEETGITPILGAPLPRQTYQVMGRPKTVEYWTAAPGPDEGFTPDDEIDQIRWVSLNQAQSMLTYPRDLDLVRQALQLPPTKPLIILRHAAAQKRGDFTGSDDTQRPLVGKGRSQSKAVVPLLAAFGVNGVHSSDSVRCLETVRPYATTAKVTVEQEPQFSEEGFERNPQGAPARIRALAALDQSICVCSHRPVLPSLIDPFSLDCDGDKLVAVLAKEQLKPAEMLVIHRAVEPGRWRVLGAERHTAT